MTTHISNYVISFFSIVEASILFNFSSAFKYVTETINNLIVVRTTLKYISQNYDMNTSPYWFETSSWNVNNYYYRNIQLSWLFVIKGHDYYYLTLNAFFSKGWSETMYFGPFYNLEIKLYLKINHIIFSPVNNLILDKSYCTLFHHSLSYVASNYIILRTSCFVLNFIFILS